MEWEFEDGRLQLFPVQRWTCYITSLYFSIVTMATVGYGDIHVVNNREMIFIISYVSGDMILGAYLLGNMTTLIVKGTRIGLRIKTDLIKYMNKNNLRRQISNKIKGHLHLQYESSYNKAAILQDIPATFKAKISQKLYDPYIKDVPLFKGRFLPFIKHIPIEVQEELFLPGKVIIEEANVADHLYIVCYGKQEFRGRLKGLLVDPLDKTEARYAFLARMLSKLAANVSLLMRELWNLLPHL